MKLVLTAPEKSSIPGAVQLVEIGGLLTIVPEDVAIEQNLKPEYRKVYNYSNGTVHQIHQTLEEIQELALEQVGDQGRIAISREILEKIENQRKALIGG
jgi:uncharacterized protein Yka (UPF0111/DUF47 family)